MSLIALAYFSLSGPNVLFYIENMRSDPVPIAIAIFYYGERSGKLCLAVHDNMTTMTPGAVMLAYFSLSGPITLFYKENMGRDLVQLAITIFYYGETRGKLSLIADNKMTTMSPGALMTAYFSLSGPNILFYIENMGNYLVQLAIIIFYYGDRRGKLRLAVDDKMTTMPPGAVMMTIMSDCR